MKTSEALAAPINALARSLDERVNLKHMHRQLQAVAKVLIVTTFIEDALRCIITFSVQQQSMRIAGWQSEFWHTALPCVSVVVQTSGSLLIVLPSSSSNTQLSQVGCCILLGWCCFHPIMYHQETNWEFLLETFTIVGGLLILLSHYMLLGAASAAAVGAMPTKQPAKAVGPVVAEDDPLGKRAHATQAVGRVLICSVFIYYAFGRVRGYVARSLAEFSNADVFTPFAQGFSIVVLLYACALLIVGIKSRGVALLLAAAMFGSACYLHPFWYYLTFVGTSRHFTMEGVAHMEGYEVDAFTMADHMRYFFFQSMSTVGALLLLVVHGPGKLSMDEQQGKLVLISTHDA